MTVRYYTQDTIDVLTKAKYLLEQRSRYTVTDGNENEIAE